MAKAKHKRTVVAYKIKDMKDLDAIKKITSPYYDWKDSTYMKFAKGSYISDVMKLKKILTKYYTPVLERYSTITLSKALRAEEGFKFLSSGDILKRTKYRIEFLDDNGKKHPQSDEFYHAILENHRARKRLDNLIGNI